MGYRFRLHVRIPIPSNPKFKIRNPKSSAWWQNELRTWKAKLKVCCVKALSGHFDGKYIVLDEPATLKPNTKVKVIALENAETDADLAASYARLAEPVFKKIWDNPLDAEYDKL